MKTSIIISGIITRKRKTIETQLHNIGPNCAIKISSLIVIPRKYRTDVDDLIRFFKITTNLIYRPEFTADGFMTSDETPIMTFSQATPIVKRRIITNHHADFYKITLPTSYCTITVNELPPYPEVLADQDLDYWFYLHVHLTIDIPE